MAVAWAENTIASLNLKALEPIEVTRVEISAGTSAVHIVQKYFQARIHGFSNSIVKHPHLDLDKKILTFTTETPLIEQRAKYDVNGKILLLPMYGKGDSTISLFGVTIDHNIQFKEQMRNGKKYFKVESYQLKINIKNAHYDFKNLFDGDKALASNILNVMNHNALAIFQDMKGGIQETYGAICKSLANGLFDNVPIDYIFQS